MESLVVAKQKSQQAKAVEVSVVFPCLNEEKTLAIVIRKALATMKKAGIKGEVVVSDNGSTDRSVEIAKREGARVVHQPLRGYGNAYHKGFAEARGKYLIMADADDTYPLEMIPKFVSELRKGNTFVIGDRLHGDMAPGAMPWLHKYIGNPVLSWILRVFFRTDVRDSHCGMRGFTKKAWDEMQLHSSGMEFASEMVIRAVETKQKISQFNIPYAPRSAPSKLHSWRDGWRHLRFMLVYSPRWAFIYPGMITFFAGLLMLGALAFGPLTIGPVTFDFHWMFVGAALVFLGYQALMFGMFTSVYRARYFQLDDKHAKTFWNQFTLDDGVILGSAMFLAGLLMNAMLLYAWVSNDFTVFTNDSFRYAIIAMVLMVIGAQTVFSAFFISILGIERR